MHLDPYIILGSAIVGLLVGMTGAGGGALMTPMLILLFGVKPSTAISSDLVAAVLMRPLGAAVHMRAGTVNFSLVRWMVLGSVPAAFLGAYLLHVTGDASSAQTHIEQFLGGALLIGAAAMALRFAIDHRGGAGRDATVSEVTAGSVPAVVIGSLLSSSVPDRLIRPVIAFAIYASGLQYVGVSTTALGWILCATLLAGGVSWLVVAQPWERVATENL